MAMDQYNYVADRGDGKYIVIVNGEEIAGSPFNSVSQAETAYNSARYGGPASPSPGGPNTQGQQYGPLTVYEQMQLELKQQEYAWLLKRLEELEKPDLDLRRRAQILNELNTYASQTGYVNPRQWQGMLGGGAQTGYTTSGTQGAAATTTAAATGNYNTVNGKRTVQQMRDEISAASGGMDYWKNASDDEIIAKYKEMTRGDVTPEATSGAGSATGFLTRFQAWQDAFKAREGRDPTRQDRITWTQYAFGLNAEQSSLFWDRADAMWGITGGTMTADDWEALLTGVSQTPTLTREQLEEQKRQWWATTLNSMAGAQNWMKYGPTKQAAQSAIAAGGMGTAEDLAPLQDIINSQQGNWMGYWQGQGQGAPAASGNLMDVYSRIPSFGAVTPLPQQASATQQQSTPSQAGTMGLTPSSVRQQTPSLVPSVAQQQTAGGVPPWLQPAPPRVVGPSGSTPVVLRQDVKQGGSGAPFYGPRQGLDEREYAGEKYTAFGIPDVQPFIQPTSISRWEYNRMGPTQKGGIEGVWDAYGLNSQQIAEMWDRMRRAHPTGQVNRQFSWR